MRRAPDSMTIRRRGRPVISALLPAAKVVAAPVHCRPLPGRVDDGQDR
ncbi:hypothetical protein ATKI12_4147 [Kitasatospora sp. Ki12]